MPSSQTCPPRYGVEHSDYILGDQVRDLTAQGADGTKTPGLSWGLVLSYEQEVRVQAYEYVRTEGVLLAEALRKAQKNENTYRRYFLTPLTLEAARPAPLEGSRKRPRQEDTQAAVHQPPVGRGNGRGGGKRAKSKQGKASGRDKQKERVLRIQQQRREVHEG